MPKERRDHSSFDRSRAYPFPCSSSSRPRGPLPKNSDESKENIKEWNEALCPVCMEHPHNAVLLICSSHDKGCRPYMCDTSYRHSNCLDQFRKSISETSPQEETPLSTTHSTQTAVSEPIEANFQNERTEEGSIFMEATHCENEVKPNLLCPLCRGKINGWIVVESARRFMNAKPRSCACETCDFSGTYVDLRKHARLVHPLVRPMEADPERERSWRRMERQRDLGDLISTLQLPTGDEGDEDSTLVFGEGSLLTVFFLFRVFRPRTSARTRAQERDALRRRSTWLWGESTSTSEDDTESSDGTSGPSWHRGRVRHSHRQRRPDEARR